MLVHGALLLLDWLLCKAEMKLIGKAKLRLQRYFEALTLMYVQYLILLAFESMIMWVVVLELLLFSCPVSQTMPSKPYVFACTAHETP